MAPPQEGEYRSCDVFKACFFRQNHEGSMPNITSDAAAVQFSGTGVPSVTVKISSRYTHGPVEVASLYDIQGTIEFLIRALPLIDPDFDLRFVDLDDP